MRSLLLLVVTVAAGICAGCPSLTNMHSARPIPAGRTEVGLGGGVEGLSADLFGEDGNAVVPNVELQVRHGVSEAWDFGVKAYPLGVQADFNFLLSDSPGFALSVDPAVSVFLAGDTIGLYPWVALLLDLGNPESVVFTFGPRVGAALVASGGAGFLFGGVAGVKLQLSESFHIMPEVTAYGITGSGGGFALLWTGGVSFAFFL